MKVCSSNLKFVKKEKELDEKLPQNSECGGEITNWTKNGPKKGQKTRKMSKNGPKKFQGMPPMMMN